MEIRFKLDADKLNDALAIASIVPPGAAGGKLANYLFVVEGNLLSIYSQDSKHVMRAQLRLIEANGEGPFLYPSANICAEFKTLTGRVLTFVAKEEGGNYTVTVASSGGADDEMSSSDPKSLVACDKELIESVDERSFPAAVLRDAIAMSQAFLAKEDTVAANFQTLQIFDESKPEWEKGKGFLYASNSHQALFFQCDAFPTKKGLSVHAAHLGYLTSFLAKAEGDVKVLTGKNKSFALYTEGGSTSEGAPTPGAVVGSEAPETKKSDALTHVFGWTHHTTSHGKFSYYSLKSDQFILRVQREEALTVLNYVRARLPASQTKIKVSWTNVTKQLEFSAAGGKRKMKSEPVSAVPTLDGERDFTFNVDVKNMIDIFQGVKANEVEFRVYISPANPSMPKERAMFRTIDEYIVDKAGTVVGGSGVEVKPQGTYQCRVTRFTPSMD